MHNAITIVLRVIFAPILFLALSLSLSAGELKTGQISISEIILLNTTVYGWIQDGVKLFASVEKWKLHNGEITQC